MLSDHLGQFTIRENARPLWLKVKSGGILELDFYIEELKIAIEVQGLQHFQHRSYFHPSYEDFTAQTERDKLKRELCLRNGIKLFEITCEDEAWDLIESITELDIERPAHPNAIVETCIPKPLKRKSRQSWDHIIRRNIKVIEKERKREHPRLDRIQKYKKRIADRLARKKIPISTIEAFLEQL